MTKQIPSVASTTSASGAVSEGTGPARPNETWTTLKLKEFELLRQEIEQRSQEGRAMERNVVVVATAVVTFLASKDLAASDAVKDLQNFAWFLPPIVSVLALTRWLESAKLIKLLAGYIKGIEREILGAEGGWETFLAELRKTPALRFSSSWNVAFWATAIGAPCFLGFASSLHWPKPIAGLVSLVLGIGISLSLFEMAKLDESGPFGDKVRARVERARAVLVRKRG